MDRKRDLKIKLGAAVAGSAVFGAVMAGSASADVVYDSDVPTTTHHWCDENTVPDDPGGIKTRAYANSPEVYHRLDGIDADSIMTEVVRSQNSSTTLMWSSVNWTDDKSHRIQLTNSGFLTSGYSHEIKCWLPK